MLADVYGRTPSSSPDTPEEAHAPPPAGAVTTDARADGHARNADGRVTDADNRPASADGSTADVPATPVAAFFDLDKTIIAGSSTLAFSGPLRERGLIGRRALVRSGYAQLLLMVAGADAGFMERMRERISALCAGWEVAEVRAVIEQALGEILHPMIYAEAAALIEDHHRRGHHVVVVSASGEEMVQPIAAALGAEHSAATRMAVLDGRYTGEIDFYCYGEGKAIAARALADQHGYQLAECYAYSDSITDLPLLELVGHPHAVNPDRALRRVARAHGWPVVNFVAPIPLYVRLSSRVRSLLPTGALSFTFAMGGLAVIAMLGARWFGRPNPRLSQPGRQTPV